ncbi:hypothetical protein NSU18_01625 [Paenibacillus sp. FSL H8-0048]|uniref:hypothetical protein n=1 Tax=Paenibacillus sp. FSL H8-0048 TaxID=2954508 RepID=UPI0030F9059B
MNKQDCICLAQYLFPGETQRRVVAELLHTASGSKRICRMKFNEREYMQDVCLQVHKDKILLTGLTEADDFAYKLEEPAEVKRACYYLFNCFECEQPRNQSSPALFLSRRSYEAIHEKAGTWTLCVLAASLEAETGDPDSSAELAKVLKNQTASGELRLCARNGEGWSLQKISYIEASSGGWLLRTSSEQEDGYIIAFPLTRAELCHAFEEWLLY